MSEKEIQDLITGYKRDFFSKTGKGLVIGVASKKIHDPYALPWGLNIDSTLQMIYDYTGWDKQRVESRVHSRRYGCIEKKVIMFILNKAKVPQRYIASVFTMERSTVAKTIIEFRKKLDADPKLAKSVEKIIDFINSNYNKYPPHTNVCVVETMN